MTIVFDNDDTEGQGKRIWGLRNIKYQPATGPKDALWTYTRASKQEWEDNMSMGLPQALEDPLVAYMGSHVSGAAKVATVD